MQIHTTSSSGQMNQHEGIARAEPRSSLFRRYALYLAGILSLALLASGGVGLYFTYRDTRALLDELQQEKARAAAARIAYFIASLEQQLRGVTFIPQRAGAAAREQRYIELLKLLRLAPAVSDAAWVDATGHEHARVSRISRDVTEGDIDRTRDPAVVAALQGRTWYGRVEFRRQTEPYLSLAIPANRHDGGLVLADINLKFVSDVVSAIHIGRSGHAYVVDAQGRLISHPDASLVLRQTSFAHRPAVRTALASAPGDAALRPTVVSRGEDGRQSLSAQASIPGLGWHVIVEQPLDEAFAPLYESIARAFLLLGLGVALAVAASLALAKRMTTPIRVLEAGAKRIGEGNLEERVHVATGDELQALGEQFNRMAQQLRESYTGLEHKVEERTRQLADANRAKERFLAAASHDLRQPVHALGLFVAQLQETRDPAVRERLIARVADSSSAVSELIEALLDLSRLDTGTVEARAVECALQPLFDHIEHAFGVEAERRGLRLRVRPTDLRVITDPLLLERILINLVGNAVRYTKEGGAIVAARRRGQRVRIEVRDTGVGIPAKYKQRIFDEFFQVQEASPAASRGLGLGLAIVDRLARLLGTRVELRSIEGRGSVFTVEVPVAEAVRDGHLPSEPRNGLVTDFESLAILLVDDDAAAREATEGLLLQWGCAVRSVSSAGDARRLLADHAWSPAVLICDQHLGKGDNGTLLVAELRSIAQKEFPAVIVSADVTVELGERAAAAGLHLLHKPLNPARLRALLLHLAAGARGVAIPVRARENP